jgi:hypothetical protein
MVIDDIYEMYIDFKNISYQGYNNSQQFYLEIDSIHGMWYDGELIIDSRDTLLLHSYEKGNLYMTFLQHPKKIKMVTL